MSDFSSAEHRYRSDPMFQRLVDMLTHHIHELHYTPSELRDAAMLASLHFEQQRTHRPVVITDQEAAEQLQRAIDNGMSRGG